jgi:predicted ester cyclase
MVEHSNEVLTRRFYDEFWTRGNPDAANWPQGRKGFKRLVTTWRAAFPDMSETVSQLLTDGDWVVARFTLRGTHRGDFYGIPATNKMVEAHGIDLLRFRDGLIAEWIYCEDALGVFAQLGSLPPHLSEVAGPRLGRDVGA